MMHHGSQALFIGFVQSRRNHPRWGTKKLNPGSACLFNITHPLSGLLSGDNRLAATLPETNIGDDPRCRNSAFCTALNMV